MIQLMLMLMDVFYLGFFVVAVAVTVAVVVGEFGYLGIWGSFICLFKLVLGLNLVLKFVYQIYI